MIPAQFDYVAPATLEEVLSILAAGDEDIKPLAGGHSLVPLMKLRLAQPAKLIDLRRLGQLVGIRSTPAGLSIGAMTTHAEIAASPLVEQMAPALAQAAGNIGDRQVRARGTIGGSLAHNDPAADLPAVVLALDGELVARSASGERSIPAASFFRGLLETDLRPDELLTEVRVPAWPRSAYAKMPNPASHYALAGVAVAVRGNGTVSAARIGVTGAAPYAFRSTAGEAALEGMRLGDDTIAAAAAAAYDGRELLSDIHASAEYRAELVRVLTRRALEQLRA